MAAASFFRYSEANPLSRFAGVELRCAFGGGATLSEVRFAPGSEVPPHRHPHEQLGTVLAGTLILIVEGVEQTMRPGEAYALPGGVEHGSRGGADEGAIVLEVFVPTREEYRSAGAPARDRLD